MSYVRTLWLFMLLVFCCVLPRVVNATSMVIPSRDVRITDVVPHSTNITEDPLENFTSRIQTSPDVRELVALHPLIIEEAPFGPLRVRPNRQFGATHSGLVRRQFPELSGHELDVRQERIFALLAQAGVGIARDFYGYDALRFLVERSPGRYDFSGFDFTVRQAKRYGIEVIGRLTLHRDPQAAGMPEDWAEYCRYVAAALQRYAGQVRYWQPLKEPQPTPRDRLVDDAGMEPADVVHVLSVFQRIARDTDSQARVFFPGTGPAFRHGYYTVDSYLQEILALGGAADMDVLGVDAYASTVANALQSRRRMLGQHRHAKTQLWVAQVGVPAGPVHTSIPFNGGGSEELQCVFLARAFSEAFANGAERVFWGEFLDKSGLAGPGGDPFDATGLIRVASETVRPAFCTYRLLSAMLWDFVTVHKTGEGVYTFTFRDKGPVHIVFSQ